MQHPELPIFAFLTAALVLIPLPWHWRARNVSTLAIIAWLFVVDVIYGINSLIWAGNVKDVAPVWCDITSKIVVGASYALPLAMLCICKHLEMVSSSRKVSFDSSDRRRRMIFESIMCFGLPLVFMALHYVVQGHRYDIFENTGCQAALYISIPAVMIVGFPQLLFSVITLIYAVISLHHFIRRRLTFAAHLQNSNSALTTNRYLRLIAMSVTEMVWGTVFTSFNLYNNVSPGLRQWTTWADVHSNFSRVDFFPAAAIPPQFLRIMMVFWWTLPASSIIFFIFFGFGEEAKKEYRKLWAWFKTTILRQKPASEKPKSSGFSASLPKINSNIRPLRLVDQKNPSTYKQPLNTSTTASSSYTISAPVPIKIEEADCDTFTLTTLSYYGESTESIHISPPTPEQQEGCHISISEAYPSSLLPSRNSYPPYPESVHADPEALPSPVYHRPFSPPTVYPITLPHPTAELGQSGILVTIHRQASVDDMV